MSSVLFIISTLEGGGAERTLSNIVTHFPEDWHVDILLNNKLFVQYPYRGNILSLDLPAYRENKTVLYLLSEIVRKTLYLRKIKKKNRYDACISFLPSSNIANALSGKKYGKTIVSIHSNIVGDGGGFVNKIFLFFFIKILYRRTDRIIAVSEEIVLEVKRKLKLTEDRIRAIINGCDTAFIQERMRIVPKKGTSGKICEEGQKIVLTVGRMVEEKGQWHLIRAFLEVVKQEPETKLLVVGDGRLKEYLTGLAGIYGLNEKILFLGYSDNPFWYYSVADIFVLPSLSEGYPNALAEAVCCGVPCIAADVHTGVREILAPGLDVLGERTRDISEEEYGILVPVCSGKKYKGDEPLERAESKMAEAIVKLLRDNRKRTHYKQQSIQRGKDLDISRIVDRWMDEISCS